MQELNRVVEFSENKGRAYVEAARIWLREGDRGNAIRSLERAYDLNPYNLDVLGLLVQAKTDDGRIAEANKISASLAIAQKYADAHRDILARLNTGEATVDNLVHLGQLDISANNLTEARSALDAASLLEGFEKPPGSPRRCSQAAPLGFGDGQLPFDQRGQAGPVRNGGYGLPQRRKGPSGDSRRQARPIGERGRADPKRRERRGQRPISGMQDQRHDRSHQA